MKNFFDIIKNFCSNIINKLELKIKNIKNIKVFMIVLSIIILVLLALYSNFVFSPIIERNKFANNVVAQSDENSIFHLENILWYNSATLVNNSDEQTLNSMSICQFSDISIYIDNKLENSELTDENTVKELYIDNISLTSKLYIGTQILNYKNPMYFGKYIDVANNENGRIDFRIINTNEQNDNNNYNEPTFYTDCSNPITLGYINKNIFKTRSLSDEETTIALNSKVLKDANVSLDDINSTLNFTIHIVNNLDEHYSYNMHLNLGLDEDFLNNGYSFLRSTVSGGEYRFLKN